jgi:serine/threonine protein kinase
MNHPAAPRLDGFEFLEHLGGGTSGQVWKARDTKMGVFRAIKVLHKNLLPEADAQRLLQEAQTMAQLPPGIATAFKSITSRRASPTAFSSWTTSPAAPSAG